MMEWKRNYHIDPHVLHVGTQKPHAYFIPFESEGIAREGKRESSTLFTSLCGEWDFRYYSSLFEMERGEACGKSATEKIPVPRSWQTLLSRGYDTPEYHDTDYPFFVEPPFVPNRNPVGVYEKEIYISADIIKSKKPYLTFEGVDSCFYLYVNGVFVGYSQVSHATSEFDVGEYLHEGSNRIKVLVLKWCDGSYLEDQDKLRLSGIFREVYLLWRDAVHITDLYVKSQLSDAFDRASLSVEAAVNDATAICYRLFDPNGTLLTEGKVEAKGDALWKIEVEKPLLWSDETPYLYELVLHCEKEYIRELVGIRRFEIKGRVLLVNGKPVKGKGVNRHDSHPELGAATPLEHMLRDLYIMKAHNINMLRTSHYPNDPRLLEYCDRLGLYVCNEADLEAHGMDYTEGFGRNTISDDPEWTEAYVDRAVLLMERDKNRASVLLWSIGNESGIGKNHKHMADYFHSRMPEAIVHSERYNYIEHLLRQKEPSVEGFERYLSETYIDIDSRMYATPEDCLENYIKNEKALRPLFLCEYSHAMGNGPGDLMQYWDLIWSYDCFFGGCVWEFTDHAVNAGTEASPKYLYGGDFGEKIHEANFCMDGLVYPDRRIHSGLLEYRQVLSPCLVTAFDQKKGRVTVKNRRYFTDLSDVELYYTVEEDGVLVMEGKIDALSVLPQKEAVLTLWENEPAFSRNTYLTLYFRTNKDHLWAKAHHVISTAQIALSVAAPTLPEYDGEAPLSLCEENGDLCVRGEKTVYRISGETGELYSLAAEGKELLASPVSFALWRAPTDNDRNVRKEWQRLGYDRMKSDLRFVTVEKKSAESIAVRAELWLGADAAPLFARLSMRYLFEKGNGVRIDCTLSLKDTPKVTLPRVGVAFFMPKDYERLRYFGRGPVEAYRDKNLASRIGLFECAVSEHFEHYLKPQENMAHADTRFLTLTNKDNFGLYMSADGENDVLSFNAAHFTPMDLTRTAHDFELVPREEIAVNLDLHQAGIGSNSCGPALLPKYSLLDKEYRFAFRLIPIEAE